MEGTSIKCQKLSIDRISTLPDDVTNSILSFLPTKNSIATSVLSKRWRYVWAHVPNIDLDSEHGGFNLGGASFSDIVYRVMLMYKVQNMNTFRLAYKHPCSEYQLETCFATAIVRNVKNLHLDLRDQVKLPLCIFTYKTLVELRLCNCGSIPAAAASAVYLPALKNLSLDKVRYECDKSLAHLLSGCPLLEELFIVRRSVDPLVCCSISSQTLIKLNLITDFANDGSYTDTYSVKIDAPALKSLLFLDTVSNQLSSTMQFRNLTTLSIFADCPFLANFLTCADNLEALMIIMHQYKNNQSCGWLPSAVPTCLSSRVQQITIVDFRCTPDEYTMIAYYLRNAKVLKRMDLHSRELSGADLKAKSDALNHISSFQRGSEACQVVFH